MLFSDKDRQANLAQMEREELDVLIIGGGIVGAGALLDGVSRGLKIGLVEMGDYSSGTSSRSTKLLHGGLRHLQNLEIKGVKKANKEKARIFQNAPHIVRPVRMMLPFYRGGTLGSFITEVGLDLYDFLGKNNQSDRNEILTRNSAISKEPYLKTQGLRGAGIFLEYQTDDSRLTLEIIKKAAELGALAANYVEVTKLLYSQGEVAGVEAVSGTTNEQFSIFAKRIINATGAWVPEINELDYLSEKEDMLFSRGIHIVVNRAKLPLTNTIDVDSPYKERRPVYFIPREDKVYIGTTNSFCENIQKNPVVMKKEVDYLLKTVHTFVDVHPLDYKDIESSWVGIRPLISNGNKQIPASTRKGKVFHSKSGLYSITGGNLTTYRKRTEDLIDAVLQDLTREGEVAFQKSITEDLTLSGGETNVAEGHEQYIEEMIVIGIIDYGLTEREAELIARKYGSNSLKVYKFIDEEHLSNLNSVDYSMLMYGITEEMVLHPIDFLLRRTSYMTFNMEHCQNIKEDVLVEMAYYYKWTEKEIKRKRQEIENEIQRHVTFN